MGRGQPSKNSDWVRARLNIEKRSILAGYLIELGYSYKRDGALLPAWSEFLEAIADGELVVGKKISAPPLTPPNN